MQNIFKFKKTSIKAEIIDDEPIKAESSGSKTELDQISKLNLTKLSSEENKEIEPENEQKKVEKKITIVESNDKPSKVITSPNSERGIWTAIKDTFSSHKQSTNIRHEGDSSMEPTVDETGYESQIDADLEVEEFSNADVTTTTTTQDKIVSEEDESSSRQDSGKEESLLEDSSISEAKNEKIVVRSKKEERRAKKQKKQILTTVEQQLTSPEDEGTADMIAKGSKSRNEKRKRQKK